MNLIKKHVSKQYLSTLVFCVLALVGFKSFAVSNQELMDRIDDFEFEQQNREINRQLDELLMQQIRNSRALSTSLTKTVTKKSEGNYKKISDGEVVRWMGDKECYASWDKEVKLITSPMKNHKFKEIVQVDSLIAIVYFPNHLTDTNIKLLFNKEGFFKLKSLCANR
jgi:23S rRNA maturation-related 3'-5' exoribonuclease YhaM